MKYDYLGKSGLKVSKLCLGTMNFGPYTSKEEAFKIMDRALEVGINFFDTADTYGHFEDGHPGRTERIIGEWFKQGEGRREKVVLATKVYCETDNLYEGINNERGLSAYKIRRHFHDSLKRLNTDHIELYQMHHIDRHVSWDEIYEVYGSLINQGLIDYMGSSNFAARHLVEAQYEAKKRSYLGLVCEQHKYNLLCRYPELEVIPAAKKYGIGIIVWGPLDGGLLSGKILKTDNNSERLKKESKRLTATQRKQLEAFSKLCKEIGQKEAHVALAWVLKNPAVTSVIIGPRTLEQFNDTLKVLEIDLSKETMQRLDEIFPGFDEAPEAYAW